MSIKVDIRCSDEERQLIERAVEEANRALTQLWPGIGAEYFVSYIELGSRRYDETLGEMVNQPLQMLSAEVVTE